MANLLQLPAHYSAQRVGKVWEPNFEELAVAAERWAKENKIKSARTDQVRIALMIIDGQITFCVPGFELYVGGRSGNGAVDDMRRLSEFIYREARSLTKILATMDTHSTQQIFHQIWLVDKQGRHPGAYSEIDVEDVISTKWSVNPAVVDKVPNASYTWLQAELIDYCKQLKAAKRYKLTIWPYHAMLGSIGHALVPSICEAMFFHGIAREIDPHHEIKGGRAISENYSVLRHEVLFANGQAIGQKSTSFIKTLLDFDVLIVAGEAGSHCVAWTVDDLSDEIAAVDRTLAKKVYLLEDCMSPVVVPGVVDHTDNMNAALARFKKAGMNVVKSTDPISTWPGINL